MESERHNFHRHCMVDRVSCSSSRETCDCREGNLIRPISMLGRSISSDKCKAEGVRVSMQCPAHNELISHMASV